MQQWNQLSDKFLALSPREKWLLFVCGFVGIFMLLFTLLVEPVYLDLQAKNAKMTSLTQSNQRQQGELLVLQAKLNKDPDKEINLEYKKLMRESQELSLELSRDGRWADLSIPNVAIARKCPQCRYWAAIRIAGIT